MIFNLPLGVALAPMEGVSDFPLRLWMRLASNPSYLVTPFLRITETYPPKELPYSWAPDLIDHEVSKSLASKTIPQIMAPNFDLIKRATKQILEFSDFVEINCGCPAPTVVGKGAGSGILKCHEKFRALVSEACDEFGSHKIAIKMRTGFDSDFQYENLISSLEGLPLKKLTIHGRTRKERYKGQSDWSLIEQAAKKLDFPVVGSGDITDLKQLEKSLKIAPNVSGVIIGRGALRNPWVFSEIREGSQLEISIEALLQSLVTYAYLLEIFFSNEIALIQLCKEGVFFKEIGIEIEGWKKINRILKKNLGSHPTAIPEISSRALGRVKMMWSYMRSSFPDPFFNPKILRVKSLSDFYEGVLNISHKYDSNDENYFVTPKWQSKYDWIYAGEKKPEQA